VALIDSFLRDVVPRDSVTAVDDSGASSELLKIGNQADEYCIENLDSIRGVDTAGKQDQSCVFLDEVP
jgi:hypothetical protein